MDVRPTTGTVDGSPGMEPTSGTERPSGTEHIPGAESTAAVQSSSDPRLPVDDFRPSFAGFADFLRSCGNPDAPYLTELHHARGTRRDWTVDEWRAWVEAVALWLRSLGTLTEREVLDHCAVHLDFAHQPKVVVFGEDVPFTATGKAKRLDLKARLAPRLAAYREAAFRRPKTS